MRSRLGILMAGLLALVFLFGLTGPAQKAGGQLTIAIQAEPPGLNLILTAAAASYQIVYYNINEPLLRYTPEGQIVPLLAESLPQVTETADGAEYTFRLRRGVQFHNGAPLTAADVKYTFDTLRDPATASPNAVPFADVKEVLAVDDYTVKFITKGKAASLLGELASSKGAGIIPQGSNMEELKSNPIGTGPFKFAEWVPGDHITFVKNENYWQPGIPYLDRVVFKIIPEQAASLAALLAGDVDFVDRMVAENAIQIEGDPRFKIASAPSNLAQVLVMNNSRAPFDNVLVRRAINYALDRDEIILATDLRPEWGSKIVSHMCPLNPYYIDLTGMYPHDPEKARALLAQAGYPNGFETTIFLPQPYEFHIRTGEVIADQLAQVGIRAKLEIIEWGRWLDQVYTRWDYDMTVIGHDQGLEPAANFVKAFESAKPDGSSAYYWQYTNYFIRDLLQRGRNTFDLSERKVIYAMVQAIIADDAVNAWIQDPHMLEGMKAGIEGFHILPMYVTDLSTIYWK
ncbi:MAG: ABC transporter substrate-binding protein [Candidatus Acetothermia bacterium]|nr:ABC transporter substrate-binding protein [Candidatus Acetothermia bacterium]MDH7504824.1 ABC transporter substrate-binding protein [Candidatus Acetothermia bacterium]